MKETIEVKGRTYYIKNIKALYELIEKYRSITIEQIEAEHKLYMFTDSIVNRLTGFGSCQTCSVCQATKFNGLLKCSKCFWGVKRNRGILEYSTPCTRDKTYKAICCGKKLSPEVTLRAIRERADFIEKELLEVFERPMLKEVWELLNK